MAHQQRQRHVVDEARQGGRRSGLSRIFTVIAQDRPSIECGLPLDGSRFEALIPPLVERPTFALCTKASLVFTLDQYVEHGVMSSDQRHAIEDAVAQRHNI